MYTDTRMNTALESMIGGIDVPPVPMAGIQQRMRAIPPRREPVRFLRPALAAAAVAGVGILAASPGLVQALEDKYDAALRAFGVAPPPAVPQSISSAIQSHTATLQSAQAKVNFTIVPPAGLPGDVTSSTIHTSPQGVYSGATKSWRVGESFVTFAYKRAGGRGFMLIAERYDPKGELPGAYTLEARDLPGGSVRLIKRAKFAWRNGDQMMSVTEGDGITAAEIGAIRDAMNGIALQTRDPKAPHTGHDVKFMRIPKP
jgi:hypothetical protein